MTDEQQRKAASEAAKKAPKLAFTRTLKECDKLLKSKASSMTVTERVMTAYIADTLEWSASNDTKRRVINDALRVIAAMDNGQ